MTLEERIADKNKVPLAAEFIQAIRIIAEINTTNQDRVYELWREYSQECGWRDQSALLWEFCNWNNFQMPESVRHNG